MNKRINNFYSLLLKQLLFISFPAWFGLSVILLSSVVNAAESTLQPQTSWQFRVFLDEKEIGYHNVSLNTRQQVKQVSVEADFIVKFLFFTAFRYQHQTEETWVGSCLSEIQSSTNNNGENLFIQKISDTTGFTIRTHAGEQSLDGCVRSFAYWDLELLKAERLLNTQSGEMEQVELRDLGKSVLQFEGQNIPAFKYRLLLKDKHIDLWYSTDMDWLALQSETEGGYQLSYYPQTVNF